MSQLSGLSILIVDDEVDLCRVLSWEFEDLEMKVEMAHSGNEGIEKVKTNQYDFIISDIKMPDGDGVEFFEFVRQEKIQVKGFFFMTGYSSYPKDELIAKGISGVIKKPIETEKVEKLLLDLI